MQLTVYMEYASTWWYLESATLRTFCAQWKRYVPRTHHDWYLGNTAQRGNCGLHKHTRYIRSVSKLKPFEPRWALLYKLCRTPFFTANTINQNLPLYETWKCMPVLLCRTWMVSLVLSPAIPWFMSQRASFCPHDSSSTWSAQMETDRQWGVQNYTRNVDALLYMHAMYIQRADLYLFLGTNYWAWSKYFQQLLESYTFVCRGIIFTTVHVFHAYMFIGLMAC